LAWIIVLGFVTYAIALYWAAKCNRMGGDPSIKFSLLRGFVVRYTIQTRAYPHRLCRKISWMQPLRTSPS
jgi:hypothetical protein